MNIAIFVGAWETVRNYRLANKEYNAAKKALRTATREGRKQGLKGDGLTSYTSAQQQAVNAAKAKTPFGQLTTSFRENTKLIWHAWEQVDNGDSFPKYDFRMVTF